MNYSKFIRGLAFVFLWFFCLLILLEVILRILGCLYSTKPDFISAADKQTYNILCFGDSVTYGWGIKSGQTYPKQLEEMLNNANLNKRFKVFNLGVPGSNSSQVLKNIDYLLNRYYKPDLIIVLTGANDAWNMAGSNIYKFTKKTNRFSVLAEKLKIFFSQFRTYKLAKIIALNLKGAPEYQVFPSQLTPAGRNFDMDVLRLLLEYDLSQMVNLARAAGVKLIFQNYPRGDIYGQITKEVAERFSVQFVDNMSLFNEKLKEFSLKDLFLYDNYHPNPAGYKIMARGLYSVITTKILKE